MDRENVTHEDEGKRVINFQGDEIGVVKEVNNGTAHVDPDPGITDQIRSKLGWNDADQSDYMLQNDRISTVTDDEIRLKDNI